MKIESVYKWIKQSYKRCSIDNNDQDKFKQIYYHGLIHLVTDETISNTTIPFPITLQFDEKRLTHQFRYEFQNMIVISILLVPYRHLSGKCVDKEDINSLKKLYTNLLKNASVVITNNNNNNASKKNESQISCYQLALHSCYTAIQRHEKKSGQIRTDLIEVTKFWEDWLSHNLKPTSIIFKLMYDRISDHLTFYTRFGELSTNTSEIMGLETDVKSLGTKLKLVADLNLETYGVLYKNVAKCVLLNKY